MRRYAAEAIGTFGLVFTGLGATLVGGPRLGDAGIALAFGMALAAMLFAAGPISGGHFNPAVTVAAALAGRLRPRDILPYLAAQIGGAVLAAAAALSMAGGRPGGAPRAIDAITNGYGRLSPGYYGLGSAALAEVVLTGIFVFVFLAVSAPSARPAANPALPLAAGVAYALIHLVGLPVTRLAANPARALGPALLAGGVALEQAWVFVAAPLVGGALAALAHRFLRAPARTGEPAPASHL